MPGGEIEERIRARMKRLFDASGWTQQEFAERVGREQSWASKYLRGDLDADIDTLARMAAAFGRELLPLIGAEPVTIPIPTLEEKRASELARLWLSVREPQMRESLLRVVRAAAPSPVDRRRSEDPTTPPASPATAPGTSSRRRGA